MSYEKQYGVPKRRPPPSLSTQSPKPVGREKPMSNGKSSPIASAFCNGPRGSNVDGSLEGGVATPVKQFLSSNITPRSSSRKARAGTASPVCNGTPSGSSAISRLESSFHDYGPSNGDVWATNGPGLQSSHHGGRSATGSMVSDSWISSVSSNLDPLNSRSSVARVSSPENTPQFFRANDIKPTVTSRAGTERSSTLSHSQDHMWNPEGISPNNRMSTSRVSTSGRSPTPDEQRAKFFHANERTETNAAFLKPNNDTNVSRPQLQTIYSEHNAGSPPRSSSPAKEEVLSRKSSVNKPSPRRHTRLVSNGGNDLRSPEVISNDKKELSRRSSLSSPKQSPNDVHTRSPSVPTGGSSLSRRSSISMSRGVPAERIRTLSTTSKNGALPRRVDPPSVTNEPIPPKLFSRPASPVKHSESGQSKIDQMNELAANARRERKVLDLEISNSSLLAINRTLEREMRKQNAELRRYRRLSRSGRISIAPSSRSASGSTLR